MSLLIEDRNCYYDSMDQAFPYILSNIKRFGENISPRGKSTTELLGYNFYLLKPRNRLINSPARNLNIFYCIGNFLWVMAQSNELEFINYYNDKGDKFSDDYKILRGAYGKRIFDIDGVNQYYQCVRELKIDPDSRRAIITIHLPQHDWVGSLDTPCTASLQFLIRENKLTMINHMRSQSSAMVMPYDIYLMTMIQEYMAIELGVELGGYIHFCGSMHFYENEETIIDKIIDEELPSVNSQLIMPKETNKDILKKVLDFERQLRSSAINVVKYNLTFDNNMLFNQLAKLNLPEYWSEICKVLIIKALDYTNTLPLYLLERIHPEYRKLIKKE